jgi:hypothetical protein
MRRTVSPVILIFEIHSGTIRSDFASGAIA